ncbi:MAG: hypothetical protein IJA31_06825 [Clostridia bacterium]|nr:hypothetical protein [Clostridia bacterium]
MQYKRVNIIAGHYGSGKTNIAINLAMKMKEDGAQVVCADLDIVNPYFRSKDAKCALEKKGIGMIASEYANTNVDMPAMPSDAYSMFDNKDRYAVIDLGGDDVGAAALGRFREAILEENNYDCFWVVNPFRPLTRTVELAMEAKEEIEAVLGFRFTKIINNANLGDETTQEDVLGSVEYINRLSELSGLPVAFTACKEELFAELENKIVNLFPVTLYLRQGWNKKGE